MSKKELICRVYIINKKYDKKIKALFWENGYNFEIDTNKSLIIFKEKI